MFGLLPFEKRAYDVFDLFRDMDRDFAPLTAGQHGFRTDVQDFDDKFILTAELPGFQKEDIHVDIDASCLTITATHSEETKSDSSTDNYLHRERYYGSFSRKFGIAGVENDAIAAAYKNGVLTLELPKKKPEQPQTRRLDIAES